MRSEVEFIQGCILFAFLLLTIPIMLHSPHCLVWIMGYILLFNRSIELPGIKITAVCMYQNENSTYLFSYSL